MTREELRSLIRSIDSKNAEYIEQEWVVTNRFKLLNEYKDEGREDLADLCWDEIVDFATSYDKSFLTPANVQIGDGATVVLWSDRHAGTIVKVTPCSITVQRDKATLDPNFKPEWIVDGFAGYCTNQDDQSYTYERDPNGDLYTFWWSKKHLSYGKPGNLRAIKGRHEFFDYNF